jgi:hypothetical protein
MIEKSTAPLINNWRKKRRKRMGGGGGGDAVWVL